MTQIAEWKHLHDATLKAITIFWAENEARLDLSLATERAVSIHAVGFVKLIVPYEAPWGPSISVNKVHILKSVTEGLSQLNIEMQSGDIIVVEAKQLTLNVADLP